MVRTVVSKMYQVEMTKDQMHAIIEYETQIRDNNISDVRLHDTLESIGCYDVKYSGHFGAFVFYSLKTEDDSQPRQDLIIQKIKGYAEKAKAHI